MKRSTRATKASKKALEAAAVLKALDAQEGASRKRPGSPEPERVEPKKTQKNTEDTGSAMLAQLLQSQQQLTASLQAMQGQLTVVCQQVNQSRAKNLGNEQLDKVQGGVLKLLEDPNPGEREQCCFECAIVTILVHCMALSSVVGVVRDVVSSAKQ